MEKPSSLYKVTVFSIAGAFCSHGILFALMPSKIMKYFIGSGPHDLTTTALFATIGTAALMVGFPFIGAAYVTDKEAQKKILFGFLCSAPFQYAVQLYSHSNRIHFPPVAALSHFGFMSILYVLSLYTLIQLRKQKKSKGY